MHLGATSQDIVDTAAMLVARRALGLVVGRLTLAADACAELARAHRDTPMAGRTLLQHAVPTTFGLKAAGWLVALADARGRLADLRETLPAQLGGAAGTLSALGERGIEVSALFARELALAEPTLPWHANRTPVAELGAALAIVAGVVGKVALDLQLLSQTEVAEVREAGDGGGSSAMPQKRNPVGATWARAGAELARGHASVLIGAPAVEHERGAGAWQAEGDALSGALSTTGGAAAALAGALDVLEVDAKRMRANLELSGGAIVAERLALVLAERLGRGEARTLVRTASLRAAETGGTLRDAVAGESGLTTAELDAVFDPTSYLGSAGALVDRRARPLRVRTGGHMSESRDEIHARGMEVRRAVLGDEHVDGAIERTTPFTEDFQDLITRYAWGEIWTRPGLDRRTRSCITLAALVASGREHELALHVRAARRNGLTPDEIGEVLLQCAVYCGVPAANSAFAIAQRVLEETEAS